VEINTPHGPIIIATIYLPPRRPYIPDQDIFQLLRHRKPTYILGDWNAQHPTFGYNQTNAVGRGLVSRILEGTLIHIGPHFPTFINNRSATTPDIALTNRHAHLNIHLTQGEITTSDHLPIIATLSTNPIMVPTYPRESYKHADWNSFKEALSHTHTPDLQGCPTSDIDTSLESWYDDINMARLMHIPKVTHRTIPQHKQNDTLRSLITQYTNIHNLAQTRGWDQELRTRYRQIQTQLHNANKELQAETWTRLVNELCQNHKDPKQFWLAYKKLMGTNKQHCTYIYNEQNEKIDTTQDMETIHRRFWQRNFQITDDENELIDTDTENEVQKALEQSQHLLQPNNSINFNTLDSTNIFNTPVTPREVAEIIQHTRNKTPGPSKINKTILQHLPPNMIHRLCHIFNASLATGLFPSLFKKATLSLIPKPNKSVHHVTNYRPISLLEVPGKILERIITNRLNTHHKQTSTNPANTGSEHIGAQKALLPSPMRK